MFEMFDVRLLLGGLTLVLGILAGTGRYYRSIVIVLTVITLLVADDCKSACRWLKEMKQQQHEYFSSSPSHSVGVDVGAETEGTSKSSLESLPWGVYNVISPGLEKLTGVIRGDAGSSGEQTTTDLTLSLYAGAEDGPTLHAKDGTVDAEKFKDMKQAYKRIVILLCRMKHMAPSAHDELLTAIADC